MSTSTLASDYTGHLFEEEVLGEAIVAWSGRVYKPYRQALEEVKRSQVWDPADPNRRPANDLHAEVAEALGLEDWSELKMYSAVGTALDYFHGVDALFEFHGVVVTMDVTTNEHKQEAKAELVLHPEDFSDPERRMSIARLIAGKLGRVRRG